MKSPRHRLALQNVVGAMLRSWLAGVNIALNTANITDHS